MTLAVARPSGVWRPRASTLQMIAVLAGCGVIFAAAPAPVQLWDESRTIINALEMHGRGLSLVTTYDGRPDLWNTKPPLLVWTIAGLMALIGPGEAAMRAPSLLAALGVVALVMSFTRRLTGSGRAGATAAVLLAASYGFFGEHGARTADFDMPLTFFTTAYLYLLFFAVHRRRPRARTLVVAGLLVAAAVMTKSVMGLAPGAGVALYLGINGRRWRRPLKSPTYLLGLLTSVAPIGAFLLLREKAAPGYLQAAFHNDLGGRFGATLESHTGPPWFYLLALFPIGFFSAGPLGLLAPLGLQRAQGRARLGLRFSLCVSAALLVGLSLGATKLAHYALPAYPFIAIACAIALHAFLQPRAGERKGAMRAAPVVAGLALAAVIGRAGYLRTVVLYQMEFQPKAFYGQLFDALERRHVSSVSVMEGGVGTLGWRVAGVDTDYAPQFDVYSRLAAMQGLKALRIKPAALRGMPPGTLLASCDPAYVEAVKQAGMALRLPVSPDCAVVQVRSRA